MSMSTKMSTLLTVFLDFWMSKWMRRLLFLSPNAIDVGPHSLLSALLRCLHPNHLIQDQCVWPLHLELVRLHRPWLQCWYLPNLNNLAPNLLCQLQQSCIRVRTRSFFITTHVYWFPVIVIVAVINWVLYSGQAVNYQSLAERHDHWLLDRLLPIQQTCCAENGICEEVILYIP